MFVFLQIRFFVGIGGSDEAKVLGCFFDRECLCDFAFVFALSGDCNGSCPCFYVIIVGNLIIRVLFSFFPPTVTVTPGFFAFPL